MKPIDRRRSRRSLLAAAVVAFAGWPALRALGQSKPSAATANPRVAFATTMGDFVVELYPDAAPKTVANFLRYVKEGHYDGTLFHRVIKNFMIQGGGYDRQYAERPTHAPIPNEARTAEQRGGLRNTAGTLAMARTSDPDSATAQFFINVHDNAFLDPSQASPGYAVFGRVVSGMTVVDKIAGAPTGPGGPFPTDVPRQAVVINSAHLLK
ncbi:MAG: Peptidyl-prolyl cis-trans isomerase PpiA precursor [Burkholderiaceae bacterium]|jgi:cyclophilin family peptidyl-prolyl cis-trans isomerase|nr:MAG: Peptidyl-prolyl cis-trans isomerase PpiA precursor [Burkholderiaceae bacterium]